jgi:DNA polymerase I-like protein with 3'-5' exonuclease and polymerase domains
MIVGEAPGADEDSSGTPFVGRSGTLLRAVLAEAGLTRDLTYFTNAVRCRPPENRTPTKEEQDNCRPWLAQEIRRVRPEAILCVGRVAQDSVSRLDLDVPVHSVEHPAYILRNPRKRADWERRLKALAATLLGHPAPPALVPDPWRRGTPDLASPWLAVDTETDSLEEGHGQTLVTVQLSDGESAELYRAVHPLAGGAGPGRLRADQAPGPDGAGPQARVHPEVGPPAEAGPGRDARVSPAGLLQLAAPAGGDAPREPDVPRDAGETKALWSAERALPPKVWVHNARFDLPLIGGDLDDLDSYEDTALIAYVLRYPEVGLKKLGPEITGLPLRPISAILTATREVRTVLKSGKERVTYRKVRRSFSEALAESPAEAEEYALLDAVVTSRLARVLWPQLCREPRLLHYYQRFEKPTVPILYRLERGGVLVDSDELVKIGEHLTRARDSVADTLSALLDMDRADLGSNPKIARALLASGLSLTARTETGQVAVDKPALLRAVGVDTEEQLVTRYDRPALIVRDLLAWRNLGKLHSTYVTALLAARDAQGRVHGSYNQMVTATNRLSSSDPNLQNIPARTALGKRIRRAFVARPGHLLVKADFSQLEVRIYAHYTREPVLLRAYAPGAETDVHQLVADELGIPRARAKNVLFGAIYGADAPKLAETAGVSGGHARAFLDNLRLRLPSLLSWQQSVAEHLGRHGWVETLFGWRNYYPLYRSPLRSESRAALREAANCPIQGTAGGLLKLLLGRADALAAHFDAQLVLTVHDEVVYEVPHAAVAPFAAELAALGAALGAEHLAVPLRLEVSVGPNWADQTPIEAWLERAA